MSTPLDALFAAVDVRCVCCQATIAAGCACHTTVDRCERTGRCAAHCACTRCAWNRAEGYERVNWTGLRHFARVGSPVTLCGRRIGGPPVWRRSMLRPIGREECARCTRGFPTLADDD